MNDYAELHASSAFSFLRGASLPEQLVTRANKLGLSRLAVLDRDGVYGAPRAYGRSREEEKTAPVVGAELTMEDGSAVPVLVESQVGYRNLCRLISTAKLTPRTVECAKENLPPGPGPRERKRACFATWQELAEHAEGLIALTGDEEGPVRLAWQKGGAGLVTNAMDRLQNIFGRERLFVELQRHKIRGEELANRMLVDLAQARGLPLLATGGVLHATPAGRTVADVFSCLRYHQTLDQAGKRLTANVQRHLHSAKVMTDRFADLPEAVLNTRRLADRLTFSLQDLDYRFPDYPVPPGHSMKTFLRERAFEGAKRRFLTIPDNISQQMEKELELVDELGFNGYFLIVWDICRWCGEQGILVQGRGSAANSAVCYALHITAVDPVKHHLLFERFLSRGRKGKDGSPSWPDIDLDLPSGEMRERAIQQIYHQYRDRGAAMVANVITYRGRSTAREVGKVLELPDDVLDRFSALYANGDFPDTLDFTKQLKMSGLPVEHPRLRAMISVCDQIRNLPRHLGQHSGGMVLSPGRLDQVVPIENATMIDRTVVQWDKEDCEDLGLVKIDFLGLGMMAVLQDCTELCQKRGRTFALHGIDYQDEPTFEMMRRADTIGVFQIESRAQMASLPRIQPRKFYDVAMQVAIVRPGPITGGVTYHLVRRRAGLEEAICIDPQVHDAALPVLGRTCGVILFQEQMLELAMVLADFSGDEAEELRRALSFHRSDERLKKISAKLQEALRKKNLKEDVIKKIVEAAASFALYGFPESHAISFALLAYASTWLKVHRVAEFYASLLNNQPMGFYSSATLVQDGRRHKLKVRPVCVQSSAWKCTVEADDVIRIGLLYIKGLREASIAAMCTERALRPFASMDDFLRRTNFSVAERRGLAASGALNSLAGHRRAALWQVEAAWSAEESLFRSVATSQWELNESSPLAPMTLSERLGADFRELGLTTGTHPMRLVRDQLPHVSRASDLPLARDGEKVTIGGSVICRQRPGTAKGVVFVSLEDETGVANAIVSSEFFERVRLMLNEESALCITGRLQNQQGVIHVKAEKIEPLRFTELPVQASHDFH